VDFYLGLLIGLLLLGIGEVLARLILKSELKLLGITIIILFVGVSVALYLYQGMSEPLRSYIYVGYGGFSVGFMGRLIVSRADDLFQFPRL